MATTTERDGTRPNPPLLGSLAFLVLSLPIGITSFVFVVTMMMVGIGTVIVWVGLAVLAVTVLATRGMASLERMRVHAMLGTYVASPYRPTGKSRWFGRMKDPATWKDLTYLVLMLPIGIAEFTIAIVTWSVGLYLTFLPLYWSWLPVDWQMVLWDQRFLNADSWVETLPYAGLGVLVLALSVLVTRGLGTAHAHFARAMLGQSPRRVSKLEGLSTAGAIDWSTEWPANSTNYGPVSR
jgi:putative sensor protein